jgi:hypothetical protein
MSQCNLAYKHIEELAKNDKKRLQNHCTKIIAHGDLIPLLKSLDKKLVDLKME